MIRWVAAAALCVALLAATIYSAPLSQTQWTALMQLYDDLGERFPLLEKSCNDLTIGSAKDATQRLVRDLGKVLTVKVVRD